MEVLLRLQNCKLTFKTKTMKKVALLISLFTLVLAFSVTTVSAQKVTSAEKSKTEKCCSKSETGAAKATDDKAGCSKADKKACSSKSDSKCCSKSETGAAKATDDKAGCAKSCGDKKAGCAKSCSKGEAKTEEVPVPKK